MSGFFSGSSSSRRYPNLNMRGKHYKKKGLFGMIPGMGSFSGSDSYSGYGGYPNQGYPNQGYPNQGYPNQNYGNQGYPDQGYAGQDDRLIMVLMPVLPKHPGTKSFQYNFFSCRIVRKKTDTVAPFSDTGRYGVLSDLSSPDEQAHLCTGVPQSGQNFAPAGRGFPQFAQKAAEPAAIFSPQDRQNFDPAGTDAPHFGQTVCPPTGFC